MILVSITSLFAGQILLVLKNLAFLLIILRDQREIIHGLFNLRRIVLEPVEFLHLRHTFLVLLAEVVLGHQRLFDDSGRPPLTHLLDLINDIPVDVVLDRRWVDLLEPVLDFLGRRELDEIFKSVPLVVRDF